MLSAPHPCLFIAIAAYLGWRFGGQNLSPAYPPVYSPLCYFVIAAAIHGVMYWAMLFYISGAMILMQAHSLNAAMCAFHLQCFHAR